MSTEWIKKKRENFPAGSMEKFLKFDGSKDVLDALKKRTPKAMERPEAISLEKLNAESLALVFVGQIIMEMHRLGERRAKREVDRESDSGIPCSPGHSGIQDQNNSEL